MIGNNYNNEERKNGNINYSNKRKLNGYPNSLPPRKKRKKKESDPDYIDPNYVEVDISKRYSYPKRNRINNLLNSKEPSPIFLKVRKKKKRIKPSHSVTIVRKNGKRYLKSCTACGNQNPPCWRKGPRGVGTLCNACGLRWKNKRLVLDESGGKIGGKVYNSLIPYNDGTTTNGLVSNPPKIVHPRNTQFLNKSKVIQSPRYCINSSGMRILPRVELILPPIQLKKYCNSNTQTTLEVSSVGVQCDIIE